MDLLCRYEIEIVLMAQVDQARKQYEDGPTSENRDEYQRAVQQLADWVLRGQVSDGAPANTPLSFSAKSP